ncbi:LysM peptidoglycan-binding domain-containing protein, partial [Glutamicibacter sp. MNS18]|uniref:LysM peptidoglycan-binding domain-containing protein n=1 Tax=Glutamicibacter sp. MNS18 TaxID=2989817 RepID=UPI00223664E4
MKIAEEHIKANLLASRIPTLGFPAQQQLKEIKVAEGSSLWTLAREYDTTVAELKKINDLDGDLIRAGQKLKVPGQPEKSSAAKQTSTNAKGSTNLSGSSYTVKAGDTMGHIALALGVSLTEVRKAAGNPSGDRITIGQKLNFGSSGSSSTKQTSTNAKGSTNLSGSSYTVKAGDTMGHIALALGVSLTEVRKAAGNPSGDRITIGQKLNFGSSGSSSTKQTS